MMQLDSEEAVRRLKKVAELYELYSQLSKFKFVNSPYQNAAKKFFQQRNEMIQRLMNNQPTK